MKLTPITPLCVSPPWLGSPCPKPPVFVPVLPVMPEVKR